MKLIVHHFAILPRRRNFGGQPKSKLKGKSNRSSLHNAPNPNGTLPSNDNKEGQGASGRELLWHSNGFHAQKYSTSTNGFSVDWAVFPPPNQANMPFYVEFISSQNSAMDPRSPVAFAHKVYPSTTGTNGVSSLITASQTGTGTFHMRLVNKLHKVKKTIFSYTETVPMLAICAIGIAGTVYVVGHADLVAVDGTGQRDIEPVTLIPTLELAG